jgi:hypothetical protein
MHKMYKTLAVLIAVFFAAGTLAATVFTEQKGQFKQCRSALGLIRYVCIPGTGCAPSTTVCEAPPATKPTVVPQPAVKLELTPVVVTHTMNMDLIPKVDTSLNMRPSMGFNTLRVQPTTEIAPASGGEFRIGCAISHMNNDDPIIYPNQQGAAHHHTYFGNTSVDYKSDLNNLAAVGNSTCSGGIMNRSAYWVPSMINTETNAPIAPASVLVYYKSGGLDGALLKAPPKGLRVIAGNAKAVDDKVYNHTGFTCHPGPKSTRTSWPRTATMPTGANCAADDDLMLSVFFPQCWDGVNLDSPNHKDHMAYPSMGKCPATHPVGIPEITVNVHYTITPETKLDKWRLSSDNYTFNGTNTGYSAHSDYVEGWNREFLDGIIKNCINAKKDAHAHLLCDGRMFY